ncbi:MAG: type II secretion system F family protein [Nocardioidaceae bacterium]
MSASLLLVMLVGALAGLGVFLLVTVLQGGAVTGAAGVAQIDSQRSRNQRDAGLTSDSRHLDESVRVRRVGSELRTALADRGIDLPASLTANLGIVGQSVETFLARTVGYALLGVFLPFLVLSPLIVLAGFSPIVPLWLTGIGALVGAVIPYSNLARQADVRRRDFRHVVSSFLDLVAMNLAGGRGVPEALQSATSISDGWAMVRIRDTLAAARLQGTTPWAALGQLGDEVQVDELRDLSAALALVAEDGAKVRDSLSARAGSMRRKELADSEGRAAARSQSMLVAQLLLCVGFLLFLTYPAVAQVLGT